MQVHIGSPKNVGEERIVKRISVEKSRARIKGRRRGTEKGGDK